MFRRRLGKDRPVIHLPYKGMASGGQMGGRGSMTPPPSPDEKAAESITGLTKEVRFEFDEPKPSARSSGASIIIVGLIVAYLFFQ
jgi:hypothetical protein